MGKKLTQKRAYQIQSANILKPVLTEMTSLGSEGKSKIICFHVSCSLWCERRCYFLKNCI